MIQNKIKLILISMMCITLIGCLSFGSLNYKQVKMLKQQGFVLTEEGWSLGLPERLLFEFDQADIPTNNQVELARLANQLKKFNLNKLSIIGHSDNVGNPAYNLALSEKRAQSVANIFINNQFSSQNILVIGRGSKQPINSENTDAARAENRRVTIIITP